MDHDTQGKTPAEILAYFYSSPDLRAYAKDLRSTFYRNGLLDEHWGQNQLAIADPATTVPTENTGDNGDAPSAPATSGRPHDQWGQLPDAGPEELSPDIYDVMGTDIVSQAERSVPTKGADDLNVNDQDSEKALLGQVLSTLANLENHRAELYQAMEALEAAGITRAKPHWRKDANGNPEILELLHASDSRYTREHKGRRREYIGKDPHKIAEAEARIKRWKEYISVRETHGRVVDKVRQIRMRIEMLDILVHGVQLEMLGTDTASALDPDHDQRSV
jgi:hypothetical protein